MAEVEKNTKLPPKSYFLSQDKAELYIPGINQILKIRYMKPPF
jgi:hypothetical protein